MAVGYEIGAWKDVAVVQAGVAGVLLGLSLRGVGGGLYRWSVAVLVGYPAALASAWVLLVEIPR